MYKRTLKVLEKFSKDFQKRPTGIPCIKMTLKAIEKTRFFENEMQFWIINAFTSICHLLWIPLLFTNRKKLFFLLTIWKQFSLSSDHHYSEGRSSKEWKRRRELNIKELKRNSQNLTPSSMGSNWVWTTMVKSWEKNTHNFQGSVRGKKGKKKR